MKVYVVSSGEYSYYANDAVFSSREAAEEAIKALGADVHLDSGGSGSYGVNLERFKDDYDGRNWSIGWYPTRERAEAVAADPASRLGIFEIVEWEVDAGF